MSNIPKFRIKGKIDSTACYINKPFTGSLTVEECDAPIKTIELQLVRVETIGTYIRFYWQEFANCR